MLRHFRHLALAALALSVLAGQAKAVDSTFLISPTSGVASLHIVWTDTVSFSDSSSTWTKAVLSGTNYTTGAHIVQELDFDDTSVLYHGGGFNVGLILDVPGYYDFGQTDHGVKSDATGWDTGSQDIFVTVTLDTGGSGGVDGG